MKRTTTTSDTRELMISSWGLDEDNEILQELESISSKRIDTPCCFLALTDDGFPMFQWRVTKERQQPIFNLIQLKNLIEPHLEAADNLIVQKHVYKDYSMILAKKDALTFCYIFRGNCKSAKNRITRLLGEVKENKILWKGLLKNARHHTMLGRWEIALLRKATTRVLSNN